MVRIIADEFLTEERDRKYYADHYTCCPPPLFILLITLIEVSTSQWRLRSPSRILPVATWNVVIQLSSVIVSSVSLSLYLPVSFSTPTHTHIWTFRLLSDRRGSSTDYSSRPQSVFTSLASGHLWASVGVPIGTKSRDTRGNVSNTDYASSPLYTWTFLFFCAST